MDHYSDVPKKFSLKINKYCNCIGHENTVRRGLKMIGDVELISINLQKNTYTLSTIKNPTHIIQALQHLLQKEVILVNHDDPLSVKSTALCNIINADEIPEFLDKVSMNGNLNSVDICIRFNLKKRSGPDHVNQNVLHGNGNARSGGRGDVSMVGYVMPPPLLPPPPPPPPPQTNIRPSAPVLPQRETYGYGYPVTTHPAVGATRPYYYYQGLRTSSDDYPKDYPCTIM